MIQAVIHSLVHFGPSMYGIYIHCIACVWLVEGLNWGFCNTTSSSKLDSCDKLESACNSFSLVLSTQLGFLAALDILRFWLQCLQNSFNHIKWVYAILMIQAIDLLVQ